MTKYDKTGPWLKCVITPEKLEQILAQVFQELQYKNLRCAETEKYAHVTYFFNGGVEKPFTGEERILVPSPKWQRTTSSPKCPPKELPTRL